MNIVLYGVPAKTAGRIAGQYGLKVINSPDKFDASGTMVLVPPISTPRYLLAFYNAMLRHEDDVDAVIICGIESCEAASTVQYCSPSRNRLRRRVCVRGTPARDTSSGASCNWH